MIMEASRPSQKFAFPLPAGRPSGRGRQAWLGPPVLRSAIFEWRRDAPRRCAALPNNVFWYTIEEGREGGRESDTSARPSDGQGSSHNMYRASLGKSKRQASLYPLRRKRRFCPNYDSAEEISEAISSSQTNPRPFCPSVENRCF